MNTFKWLGQIIVAATAGSLASGALAQSGAVYPAKPVKIIVPYSAGGPADIYARFLADRGAALLIPQADLTAKQLADVLGGLTRERLLAMAQAARAAGKPEAARSVAQACMELAA